MNTSAIFHTSYDNYCYALDDNTIHIALRTGQEITSVTLVWGDPFDVKKVDGKYTWNTKELILLDKKCIPQGLWWSGQVALAFKRCKYFFKVYEDNVCVYYLEDGVHKDNPFLSMGETLLMGPQIATFTFPYLNSIDVCRTPSWAASSVFYQIFPSRFAKGKIAPSSKENDKSVFGFTKVFYDEWPKTSKVKVSANDCYGGNLQGIIDRLDYLKALGISGIYLTPINESPSEHKYDTTDYERIDHTFGNPSTMKALVALAHQNGIKVMVDGVFNHCGWMFWAWQDVIEKREKSAYASWFMINDFNITVDLKDFSKMTNAKEGKYFSFAFTDFMPKFNTADEGLSNYIIGVCRKWILDYDIDGIRLDVANELSHAFIRRLRASLCSLKADFYLLGEAWHNVQNFLRGDEFHSAMNYPLQNVILDLLDKKLSSFDFEKHINRCLTMYYKQVTTVLFNQLDSHDTERFITRFGGNKDLSMAALVLLFSLPGTPCLYYGTEILLPGGRDPDCRRCMPWDEVDNGVYDKEVAFTKALISARRQHKSFASCNICFLHDFDSDGSLVVHYKKVDNDSGENCEVVINLSSNTIDASSLIKDFANKAKAKEIGKDNLPISPLLFNRYQDGKVLPEGFIILAD